MNHQAQNRRGKTGAGIVCTLLTVLWIAAPVTASPANDGEEPQREISEATSEGERLVNGSAQMRVVFDPETGEFQLAPLREDRTLSPHLAKALRRSSEGLESFALADGGVGVDLKGRFQHVFMARVTADGSIEMVCVNHLDEAEKFVRAEVSDARTEPAVR